MMECQYQTFTSLQHPCPSHLFSGNGLAEVSCSHFAGVLKLLPLCIEVVAPAKQQKFTLLHKVRTHLVQTETLLITDHLNSTGKYLVKVVSNAQLYNITPPKRLFIY